MVTVPSPFSSNNVGAPAFDYFTITPSNSTPLAIMCRGIYVGGGGDITVISPAGSTVTFVAVPQGVLLPIVAQYVKSTGTNATDLVAFV